MADFTYGEDFTDGEDFTYVANVIITYNGKILLMGQMCNS